MLLSMACNRILAHAVLCEQPAMIPFFRLDHARYITIGPKHSRCHMHHEPEAEDKHGVSQTSGLLDKLNNAYVVIEFFHVP